MSYIWEDINWQEVRERLQSGLVSPALQAIKDHVKTDSGWSTDRPLRRSVEYIERYERVAELARHEDVTLEDLKLQIRGIEHEAVVNPPLLRSVRSRVHGALFVPLKDPATGISTAMDEFLDTVQEYSAGISDPTPADERRVDEQLTDEPEMDFEAFDRAAAIEEIRRYDEWNAKETLREIEEVYRRRGVVPVIQESAPSSLSISVRPA